ncbi:tellurite resistance TerB family protein [Acuticoccus sp.]|uniref:tellurite resistance TerB family protein n=1 Tax=Acuticoccus sp. TaxID=1904378 RepID=UPI003B51596F
MDQPISHHEALVFAMVTMSAVDRTMTDAELRRIGEIVETVPVFRDFDAERLVNLAETCGEILQEEDGLDTILDLIATCTPKALHETAYALAVEIAAADLRIQQEELRFLALLRDRLGLEKLVVAALERGARARHRTLAAKN